MLSNKDVSDHIHTRYPGRQGEILWIQYCLEKVQFKSALEFLRWLAPHAKIAKEIKL